MSKLLRLALNLSISFRLILVCVSLSTQKSNVLDVLAMQMKPQEKSLIYVPMMRSLQDENDLHLLSQKVDELEMKWHQFSDKSNSGEFKFNDEIRFHLMLRAYDSEIVAVKQKLTKRLNDFDEYYHNLTQMLEQLVINVLNKNMNEERIFLGMTIASYLESFETKTKLTLIEITRSIVHLNNLRDSLNKEIIFSCNDTESTCFYQSKINLIQTCPDVKSSGTKYHHLHLTQSCIENRVLVDDKVSIFSLVPVVYANKTYANIYCMICNEVNIDLSQLDFFKLTLNDSDFGQFLNVLNDEVNPAVVMSFESSEELDSRLKMSKCLNVVDTCSEHFQRNGDHEIEFACKNHTSIIRVERVLYRNKYCAYCNEKDSFDLECGLVEGSIERLSYQTNKNLRVDLTEFALVNDNKYNNYLEFVLKFKIFDLLRGETSLSVSCVFEKFSFHLAGEHYETADYDFEDLNFGAAVSFCENLFDETLLESFKNFSLMKKEQKVIKF